MRPLFKHLFIEGEFEINCDLSEKSVLTVFFPNLLLIFTLNWLFESRALFSVFSLDYNIHICHMSWNLLIIKGGSVWFSWCDLLTASKPHRGESYVTDTSLEEFYFTYRRVCVPDKSMEGSHSHAGEGVTDASVEAFFTFRERENKKKNSLSFYICLASVTQLPNTQPG